MNLVVELLGAPGVGKSTLIPEIRAHLAVPDAPRTGRAGKALGLARFVATHPATTARGLLAIASTRQRTRHDLAWVTRTWLKRCARHAELRRRPGLHLVDAGVAQALWSIGFHARTSLDPRLLDTPLPDVVVVVEASLETVRRRLAGRPGAQSRLERDGEADHARAKACVGEVAELLAHRGVLTIPLDNDRDTDHATAARAIADRIRARWSA